MILTGCFKINLSDEGNSQSITNSSYVGGKPRLPLDMNIPKCELCNASLVFFIQITFPESHLWGGHTMSVFSCTSCYDENFLIPEMLDGNLRGGRYP